jgi:hypothetical protein
MAQICVGDPRDQGIDGELAGPRGWRRVQDSIAGNSRNDPPARPGPRAKVSSRASHSRLLRGVTAAGEIGRAPTRLSS